jgi:hypothetical protein
LFWNVVSGACYEFAIYFSIIQELISHLFNSQNFLFLTITDQRSCWVMIES